MNLGCSVSEERKNWKGLDDLDGAETTELLEKQEWKWKVLVGLLCGTDFLSNSAKKKGE